jgi:hypothetical protein
MIDINKTLLKTIKLTDNLVQRLYDQIGSNTTVLEVSYLKKKFSIERRFQNTYDGKTELALAMEEFNTEEKVKAHFGI